MPEGRKTSQITGHFAATDGKRLYFVEDAPEGVRARATGEPEPVVRAPRALVLLMHGFAEHCARYDALSTLLAEQGHVVRRFDARGHGRSEGPRGHVRAFDEYVDDFASFARDSRALYPRAPLFLLGHSNGGLISLRALQEGRVAPLGLVVTSPLLCLRKKPVPDVVAKILSWATPGLPLPNGIRTRDLTHDPELLALHATDRWVHRVATPRWYWSTALASRRALVEAAGLTLPLLVVCGESDPLVDPSGAKELYTRAASSDKQLVERRGEYHEVLNEVGRLELFDLISAWMDRVLAAHAEPR